MTTIGKMIEILTEAESKLNGIDGDGLPAAVALLVDAGVRADLDLQIRFTPGEAPDVQWKAYFPLSGKFYQAKTPVEAACALINDTLPKQPLTVEQAARQIDPDNWTTDSVLAHAG